MPAGRCCTWRAIGRVVVPYSRIPSGGWLCLVVAGRRPGTLMPVSDDDLETAVPVALPDPLTQCPPAQYAAVWRAQVCRRWPAGAMGTLADWIAAHAVDRVVTLDLGTRPQLLAATGLHESGPDRLLRSLAGAGYLDHDTDVSASWRLTMPDQRRRVPSDPVHPVRWPRRPVAADGQRLEAVPTVAVSWPHELGEIETFPAHLT